MLISELPLLAEDLGFAKLMLKVCKVSTASTEARVAIQRLSVHASSLASKITTRTFSALVPSRMTCICPASSRAN